MSSSGSCTSAAASCTRCWLPWDSVSILTDCLSATPRRAVQRRADVAGVGRAHAVEAAQVLELLQDDHAGVEAAFLRHVAEGAPCPGVDGRVAPAHLATVEGDHADDGAHGGGLAGAVGAEKAEDLAGRHGEAQAVEGDHGPVAAPQVEELQGSVGARRHTWVVRDHLSSPGLGLRCPSPARALALQPRPHRSARDRTALIPEQERAYQGSVCSDHWIPPSGPGDERRGAALRMISLRRTGSGGRLAASVVAPPRHRAASATGALQTGGT